MRDMKLSDEEALIIEQHRGRRVWTVDDLEPEAFAKLTPAERADLRAHVMKIAGDATAGR